MLIAMSMMAIPAKPGLWSTISLADGRQVSVRLVGDEHGHWLQAADGTCYVKVNDVYEEVDEQTLQGRRASRMETKQAKRRAIYASTSDGLGQYGTMSRGAVPSIGEYTIPVVMVQFSDTKFKTTTTVEKMKRYYNEEGYSDNGSIGSVRDYFIAQSGGQFVPTFDVVGIVTLSKSASYYGTNDSQGYDQHVDELPGHAVSAAISQLGTDFSQYVVPAGDNYHKAGVPLLCMLYAGKGEATEQQTSANTKLMWPCEWDAEEDPIGGGTYNNVHFNSFFIGNEQNSDGSLMGLAVFCHEFGHALGLPDFYVTNGSYSYDDPFGFWSIMDSGSYVSDDCTKPVGYNAYEKSYMGWLDLKEVGNASSITLQSPLGLAKNSACIIRNSSSETFIFENRQPGTWYPSIFGNGVLVTRIAYSYNDWSSNTVNNNKSKKRACVLTADGSKNYYSAKSSNLYGNAKTSITSLKTREGNSKQIGIKNIIKYNDGTIKLVFNDDDPDPDPDPDPQPQPQSGDTIFYESFNQCKGTGGNDGKWSENIAVGAFNTDNEGWSNTYAYGANKCARFGRTSNVGVATTPAIALDGTATLTFKAGAWDADKDGTTLSLSIEDGTVTPAEVTMTKGAFTDFTATVTGTGSVTITFMADKGRFFLDEVLVSSIATGIHAVGESSRESQRIYTLDGRYVGTSLQQLPRGLYIVGGRKVVR